MMIYNRYNSSVLTYNWKIDNRLCRQLLAFFFMKKIIFSFALHINKYIFIFIFITRLIFLLLIGLDFDWEGLLFSDSSESENSSDSSNGQSNGEGNGRPEGTPNDQPDLIPNGESNQDSNDHNSDDAGSSEGEGAESGLGSCTCCDQDQDTEGPCGCNYDCSPDMMNNHVDGSNGVCCGCRSNTYNYYCNDCTCTYCNNCYNNR